MAGKLGLKMLRIHLVFFAREALPRLRLQSSQQGMLLSME